MTTRTRHAHHWRIEAPSAAAFGLCPGRCKLCGATRTFTAAWQYADGQQPMVLNHVDAEARRIAAQEYRVYGADKSHRR